MPQKVRIIKIKVKEVKCSKCHKAIPEEDLDTSVDPFNPRPRHTIAGKPVCKKDYYEELGDIVEKHRIGFSPKRIKSI